MRSSWRIVSCVWIASVVANAAAKTAWTDIVSEAVDRVSPGQYRAYQVAIQEMGLGSYGGWAYDQGYRDRDGWLGGGTLGNQEARLYLADQLAAMGLEVSIQGSYKNVVAQLRGAQRPEEIYIICAHFDTTTFNGERPGGDDNASGTAGVLEAARVLMQYEPDATVRFIAFNAEEDWMLGSQNYVDSVVVAGNENIVGVLNLDMILRPGWDRDPLATIDLDIVTDTMQDDCEAWAYTFMGAVATYVPSLVIDAAAPLGANWNASDQGPFLLAGYPALMIAENTAAEIWSDQCNAYYHKAGDASDGTANDPSNSSGVTYDYDFATDVVRAAVATLAQEAGIAAKAGPAFVGFQALPTDGAQDVEPFAIGDDVYLAIANGRNDITYDVNAVVCKWDGNDFVEVQSIPSHGAADCEFFTLAGEHYLAIANLRDDTTYEVESKLYRWNGTAFGEFQSIQTAGATDCEFFMIGDGSYLAIANSHADATTDMGLAIYRWDGTAFASFQSVAGYTVQDCEYFTIGDDSFLAFANKQTDTTHNVDSHILRWDGTQFVLLQSIATQGAADWEFFTVADDSYLIVANSGDDASHNMDSRLYKWDGESFVAYQFMPTQGAADWEFFSIGADLFLAVANGCDGAAPDIDSTVYRWNGTRFVELLSIPTHGASDLAFIVVENTPFLVAANSRNDLTTGVASHIYRYEISCFDDSSK